MRKIKIILIGLCILSGVVHADALKNLDDFLRNSSITADFTQTVYGIKKNRISQGTMQIERPNRFRWEYTRDGQLIISDSKKIYIYDKPLQQVTEKRLNNLLGKSPALLLAGGNDVKKYYEILPQSESAGMEWVSLTPKNINDNNGFKVVSLGFDKKTHLLSQMNFTDNFDNKSMINFTNLKLGVKLPAATFVFTPPKGTDVISSED